MNLIYGLGSLEGVLTPLKTLIFDCITSDIFQTDQITQTRYPHYVK